MIIGITGNNASGKGECAEVLKRMDFVYFSLSDMIREECTNRGLSLERVNLILVANDLRKKEGPGCWAKRLVTKLSGDEFIGKDIIVDSIRHPDEVKELRLLDGFVLFCVEADVKLRHSRALKRGRIGEDLSFEKFVEIEERENSQETNKQQVSNTTKLADYVIDNNGTLEELDAKVIELVDKIKK